LLEVSTTTTTLCSNLSASQLPSLVLNKGLFLLGVHTIPLFPSLEVLLFLVSGVHLDPCACGCRPSRQILIVFLFCGRWAAGVERLALLLDPALVPEAPRPIYVIVVTSQEPGCDNPPSTNFTEGENTLEIAGYAMRVSAQIRQQGYIVMQTVGTERALRKWLKKASKAHAAAVALVGSAEFKANSVTVKIMDTGDQHSIGFHHLEEALKQHLPHLSK